MQHPASPSGQRRSRAGAAEELRRGRLALARLAEVERELALVRHHQDAKIAELEERLGWFEENELDLRDAGRAAALAGLCSAASGARAVKARAQVSAAPAGLTVSVAIPVLNGERYLEEVLAAVFAQRVDQDARGAS